MERLTRLLDRGLPRLTTVEEHTDVVGERRAMDMVRLVDGPGSFDAIGALLTDIGFSDVTLPTGKSDRLEV